MAKGLRGAGHVVDLHNLKDGPAPASSGYDVLGIGTPAYYFRPPFLVTDHLNSLSDLDGKPFFVFILHGSYPGDTGSMVRRAMEGKGGREIGYDRYHSAGYFLGYLKRGYLFSPNHPKPDTLVRAGRFGQKVAARLAGGEYRKADRDPGTHLVYRIERFLTNRLFSRQVFSRLFRLDRGRCTACGLCARSCPTRNICEDERGLPLWGRDCILCFSCEMRCPKDAINSTVTWFLFRPFTQYNVWRASRDPKLENARVEHRQGRTRVVG